MSLQDELKKEAFNDATSPRGCLPALGFIGSLAVGAYHGVCDAKGVPVDPLALEEVLKFGPAIFGGIQGWYTADRLMQKGNVRQAFEEEADVAGIPNEARGCAENFGKGGSFIAGASFYGIVTAIGYAGGRWLGNI